jgi:hypothetical protein
MGITSIAGFYLLSRKENLLNSSIYHFDLGALTGAFYLLVVSINTHYNKNSLVTLSVKLR